MKALSISSTLPFFGIGVMLAVLGLSLNQQFPFQIQLASLLSPTGAQVTLAGWRIKHWLVGFVIIFFSIFIILDRNTEKLGIIALGAGTALVVDEWQDILRIMNGGSYP